MAERYIEIGFPKTGTTSLARAMSILGFSTTHTLIEECARPWKDRTPAARDLLAKWLSGRVDFDVLEDRDYVGSALFPLFDRIDREVPGSRFILTVRDPASWLVSAKRFQERYRVRDVSRPLELDLGMVIRIQILGCLRPSDDRKLLEAYESHNDRVRRHFAGSDRLLVMDVCAGDGWDVLCPFVGRPAPAVPFPYENRTAPRPGGASGPGGTGRKGLRILLVRTTPPGAGTKGFLPPPLSPPMGILHLAAQIGRHRPSDEVEIVDAAMSLERHEDLSRTIDDFDPHLVGLSGLNLEIEHMRGLARAARAARPRVPVVAGGPIATSFPAELLGHVPELDAAAPGEGEGTILDIARAVESGAGLASVPGLAIRLEDGTIRATGKRRGHLDMGDLAPVDWSAIDLGAYNGVLNMGDVPHGPNGCAVIMSTRGCPYSCIFCQRVFGRKVREMTPSALVDVMERAVRDHGIRDFHLMDDIFNFRPGRILEFCREIEGRGLDVRYGFPNALRGDLLTREEIDAMASTGAYHLTLAIETASPRLQQMIRKRLDLERVFESACLCSDAGILTRGYAMLGFPTETAREMRATTDRMTASGFDLVRYFTVTPYPGTRLFDVAVENGFRPERWGRLEFGYDRDLVNASTVGDEELRRVVQEAWRSFYADPSRRRRLAGWVASHGLGEDPYIRGTHFWRRVLGADREWTWDNPAAVDAGPGNASAPAEEARTPAGPLIDLAPGAGAWHGWRVASVERAASGRHDILLRHDEGAEVVLFVEPRDESRGCMLRTARWNVGVTSDTPIAETPPGLEQAIRELISGLDG